MLTFYDLQCPSCLVLVQLLYLLNYNLFTCSDMKLSAVDLIHLYTFYVLLYFVVELVNLPCCCLLSLHV